MGLFDGVSFFYFFLLFLKRGEEDCVDGYFFDFVFIVYIFWLLNLFVLLVFDCSWLFVFVVVIVYGFVFFDFIINVVGLIFNWVGSDCYL